MHLKEVRIHTEKFPSRDVYPFSLPLFSNTDELALSVPVTFFVGENGTGKSTLLEAMARRCGIHIWRTTERSRYKYNMYEKELYHWMRIIWHESQVPGAFFSSQEFHHFSQIVDEWASTDSGVLEYFGGSSLMAQSHGQSLMSYFRSRYKIRGIYFLDEPETALSPKWQLELVRLLATAAQSGKAQFIIATHSPILMACPKAQILSFDNGRIAPVQYEQTEHYRVSKQFFDDPKALLGE